MEMTTVGGKVDNQPGVETTSTSLELRAKRVLFSLDVLALMALEPQTQSLQRRHIGHPSQRIIFSCSCDETLMLGKIRAHRLGTVTGFH